MNASGKLAAYAVGLAAVLGAAAAAGAAIEPTGLATAERPQAEHGGLPDGMALPGLAASEDDFRFVPATDHQAGGEHDYRFRILGEDGVVTDFDVEHTKRMHVIVVRRDFAGFQHLHPTMEADGTWVMPLTIDDAGTYRVFADFVVDEEKYTLGADLFVDGSFDAQALPAPRRVADAGDGYTVELDGAPIAGVESELEFTIRRDGELVDDLSDYLGARGHLVALRDGDLAYLHVHADEERLAFEAEFPTPEAYRLFLQFQHGGEVRTAEFTVEATEEV